MINNLLKRLTKRAQPLNVLLICIAYSFVVYNISDSYKLAIAISPGFILLLYVATKNVLFSIYVVFLLSSQFFLPAKIEYFQYASPAEYKYEVFPFGIYESIMINVSDIYGIILFLSLCYVVTAKKTFRNIQNDHAISHMIRSAYFYIPLTCWFFYFAFSLYSSIFISSFPLFSTLFLIQESKMLLLFIATIYFSLYYKKFSTFFPHVLISLILFQGLSGIFEFIMNVSSYGFGANPMIPDLEQTTPFSRVSGIIGSANSHALLVLLEMLLLLPYTKTMHRKLLLFTYFIGVMNIIFTQSRTVWLGAAVVGVFLFIRYKRSIHLHKYFNKKINLYYGIICAILFAFVIAPRIMISSLFWNEEGGGPLRLRMITEGWQLLQQNMWLGYGANMTLHKLLTQFPNGYAYTFPYPVHFAYLQIAIDSGILAASFFFIPFYMTLRLWLTRLVLHKRINDHLFTAVCCIAILLIYYTLQPVYARREFVLLGLVFSFTAISTTAQKK